ncbi:MAG: hypothetical protein AAGA32_13535, partial [Pseudomonadota bacterium]
MIWAHLKGFAMTAALIGSVVLTATPGSVFAQDDDIDRDLREGVDFRSILFRPCYGEAICTVGPLTLIAETRLSQDDPWSRGRLYWDPVDGIGVLGGGQDDEIDFNERIILRTSRPLALEKIWFTDLFVGEIKRYLGYSGALRRDIDFEAARVTFDAPVESFEEIEVTGLLILPPQPFNEKVDGGIFAEPGDIHNRLIIDGPEAILLVPEIIGAASRGRYRIDDIEPGKLNLFADGDLLDYDLRDVFGETETVDLYQIGAHNARQMARILEDTDRLLGLGNAAATRRGIGDIPNGEVMLEFLEDRGISQMTFYAPA